MLELFKPRAHDPPKPDPSCLFPSTYWLFIYKPQQCVALPPVGKEDHPPSGPPAKTPLLLRVGRSQRERNKRPPRQVTVPLSLASVPPDRIKTALRCTMFRRSLTRHRSMWTEAIASRLGLAAARSCAIVCLRLLVMSIHSSGFLRFWYMA